MKALCACIFSCMAVEAGCPAPTAALLGHPRLELCGMDVRPALRFSLRPPVMMLRLLCRYEDQLGAPVYYDQNTEDITCTDSSGNVLKISHVCSESEKSQRPFHGDPVRICMRSPAPDSSAEWVRLRGSLLCAFGEETAELDPVTFFLEKEEARVRVPLPDSSGKEVTLSLKKYPEAWGLKVEGDMDFHFSSFLVRDEEGMVLPEYAWRQGSSFFPGSGQESGKSRFWETGYLVPEKIRSLKVTVSYWNKVALRQVPLDLRIGAGGMMAP